MRPTHMILALSCATWLASCGGGAAPTQPTAPAPATPTVVDGTSFVHTAGGISGTMWGKAVAADPDGATITMGGFTGMVVFEDGENRELLVSGGSYDAYVVRYRADGLLDWVRTCTGDEGVFGHAGTVDAQGNVTIGGFFTGTATFATGEGEETAIQAEAEDGFLARYDRTGRLLWVRRIASPGYDEVLTLATRPDGSLLVGGLLGGPVTFGEGELAETTLEPGGFVDGFVACYEAEGELRWARAIRSAADGKSYSTVWSLMSAEDGCFVVAGDVVGSATFVPTSDSAIDVETNAGSTDVYAALFAPDGTPAWVRRVGGSGTEQAYGVAWAENGTVEVGGSFVGEATVDGGAQPNGQLVSRGSTDGFVASWNVQGDLLWSFQIGGAGRDSVFSACAQPDGTVLVAGCFASRAEVGVGSDLAVALDSAGEGDCEVFVASMNPEGTLRWCRRLGGAGDDHVGGIARAPDGDILLTGSYAGEATFGWNVNTTASLPAHGTNDGAFVLRVDAEGNLPPTAP